MGCHSLVGADRAFHSWVAAVHSLECVDHTPHSYLHMGGSSTGLAGPGKYHGRRVAPADPVIRGTKEGTGWGKVLAERHRDSVDGTVVSAAEHHTGFVAGAVALVVESHTGSVAGTVVGELAAEGVAVAAERNVGLVVASLLQMDPDTEPPAVPFKPQNG